MGNDCRGAALLRLLLSGTGRNGGLKENANLFFLILCWILIYENIVSFINMKFFLVFPFVNNYVIIFVK